MAQVPFVLNPALVAIAVDYSGVNSKARGYIADMVCPRVRTDGPLFRYPQYNLADAFTVYDNQADRLGALNEILTSATEAQGATLDWGLISKIPYRDMAAQQQASIPFNLKTRAVRNVIDKNQLAREIRVANLLFSTGSYSSGYTVTLSGTSQWSDYTNSNPVAAIKTARRKMLVPPNVAVMSSGVRDILSMHPALSIAIGGSQTAGRVLSDEEIARVLGFERIIVANTLKQTSKRGQTVTTAFIWGDHFAMLYIPATDIGGTVLDDGGPAFALSFQWGDIVSGENQYRPAELGLWGGVGVYTGESLVEKLVAPFAGYLFLNAAVVP